MADEQHPEAQKAPEAAVPPVQPGDRPLPNPPQHLQDKPAAAMSATHQRELEQIHWWQKHNREKREADAKAAKEAAEKQAAGK
jgi:hypothetical protein